MPKLELCRSALKCGTPVRLLVTGTSMIPALWPGDRVTVHPATTDELRTGDVAVFARDGQVIVHRIVGVRWAANLPVWTTRGDNQSHDDLPLRDDELLGVVTGFQRFGIDRAMAERPTHFARSLSRLMRHSGFARVVINMIHARFVDWLPSR